MYEANMNVPKEFHEEFVSRMKEDHHMPEFSPVSSPTMSFSDYAMDDEQYDSDRSSTSDLEKDDRNHDESEQLENAESSESGTELEQSVSGDTEINKRTVESESEPRFSEISCTTAVFNDENNNINDEEPCMPMFGPNFINIDGNTFYARIRIGGNEQDSDQQLTTTNKARSFVPLQFILDSLFTTKKVSRNSDRANSLHTTLTAIPEELKSLPDYSQTIEEVNKSSEDGPPNITSMRIPQYGEPVPEPSTISLESNSCEPVTKLRSRTFPENPVAGPSITISVPVKDGTQGTTIRSMRRKKRNRTAFTTSQLEKLEAEYSKCHYIDRPTRINLAKTLSLNEKAIKVWYQNRRMKDKRDSDDEVNKDFENIGKITPQLNYNQPSISRYNLKSSEQISMDSKPQTTELLVPPSSCVSYLNPKIQPQVMPCHQMPNTRTFHQPNIQQIHMNCEVR